MHILFCRLFSGHDARHGSVKLILPTVNGLKQTATPTAKTYLNWPNGRRARCHGPESRASMQAEAPGTDAGGAGARGTGGLWAC